MKKYARSKTSIIEQLNYISICLCTKGSTSACFPFTAFSSRFLYLIATSFFLTFCLLRLPSFQYVNAKTQNWIEKFKTSVKATSSQRHSDCFSQYVSFELPGSCEVLYNNQDNVKQKPEWFEQVDAISMVRSTGGGCVSLFVLGISEWGLVG